MLLIKLTKGKFAKVDDSDFYYLNQWKWQASERGKTFYAVRSVKDKITGKRIQIKMHRILLNVSDKSIFVDHKDHDGLNNQRVNLRECTRSENGKNRLPSKRSSSRFLGVKFASKKWRAEIKVDGKNKHLGCFALEIDAARAYNDAAIIHHGEFANLNILS